MPLIKAAILGLLVVSTYATAGDCINPETPAIPDGASSTIEQMIASQKAVKSFQAANIEYMACIEPGLTAAGVDLEAASKNDKAAAQAAYDELEAAYNDAVSVEEEAADQFNAAIREYKGANPG